MIRSPYNLQRKKPSVEPHFGDLATQFQQFLKLFGEMKTMHAEYVQGRDKTHELIKNIKQGPPGQGIPGRNAVVNEDAIVEKILNRIPATKNEKVILNMKGEPGAPGKHADPEAVLELLKEKKLDIAHIKGLDEKIAEIRNAAALGTGAWKMRGGGDTVTAGSGITISNTNGVKTISTAGSGSITPETAVGTINGVNTIFTVSNTPLWISVDGVNKFLTTNYTYAAGTITITDGAPPALSIISFH